MYQGVHIAPLRRRPKPPAIPKAQAEVVPSYADHSGEILVYANTSALDSAQAAWLFALLRYHLHTQNTVRML